MKDLNRTESYKHLGEECGVFGMYDFDGGDVADSIYYGLVSLQHRGQESCGIAVTDTKGPKGRILSLSMSSWVKASLTRTISL